VTAKSSASIEDIGCRLLQASRPLFRLPVLDEMQRAFQDLTANPILRLSKMVEPFCGSDSMPLTNQQTESHPADIDFGKTTTPQPSIEQTETPTHQPVSSSLQIPPRSVSRVLRAMKVLNGDGAHQLQSTGRRRTRQTSREAAVNPPQIQRLSTRAAGEGYRVPIQDRGRDRSGQPVRPMLQSAGDSPDPISSTLRPEAPAVAAVRLAQGAPRIASLLQAHLADSDNNVESMQRENTFVIETDAKAPNLHPQDKALDIDLLTDKLAERLEFELLRMYGTSQRS